MADRTIEIALKRKAAGETVARFRRREVAEAAEPLHQALDALASYHVDALAEARPELPDELDDRAQDAWEPLLAIADLAGGEWPTLTRRAALALSDGRATSSEDSDRLQLLGDVRDILDRLGCGRILTADLITELARDDESLWTEWCDEREDKAQERRSHEPRAQAAPVRHSLPRHPHFGRRSQGLLPSSSSRTPGRATSPYSAPKAATAATTRMNTVIQAPRKAATRPPLSRLSKRPQTRMDKPMSRVSRLRPRNTGTGSKFP